MINFYSCTWYSGHFLELNYQIIKQINPNMKFRWLICNHNPVDFDDLVVQPEYHVYERKNDNNTIGSISHGNGLNFLMKKALDNNLGADYHFVLDSDFYIVQPVEDMIHKMERLNVDIFGATYSKTFKMMLYKYPASFCQLFRGSTVKISKLNFATGIDKRDWGNRGFVPDVGHRIALDAKRGKYSYYTIPCNITGKTKTDVYYDDETLFGMHVHTRRNRRNVKKAQLSNNLLLELENTYDLYRTPQNTFDVDFSYLHDINLKSNEDNTPVKFKKESKNVP